MKHLKIFEAWREKTLYKNKKFKIYINVNKCFCYSSKNTESSAILAMADLIKKKSEYLSDEKLRNIEMPEKDKNDDIEYLNNYKNSNRKNIINNKSSAINHFLSYNKIVKTLPIDIYINLIDEYSPKIINIIEKSKTLGDIIDHFTILYDELIPDLELKSISNKYNL